MLHGCFFIIGHVAERGAVGTQVETYQLHDALAAHYVAAIMAYYVDYGLREVLLFACCFDVALFPCFDYAHEFAAVIVGGATYAALCAALRQTWQYGFVLAVQHIIFAALVESALIVFVKAFEGVLDAGEIRYSAVYSLEQLGHGQECAVECRNVIVVEWQIGCCCRYGFAVFHKFFYATDFREWRSHRSYAPYAEFRGMLSEAYTVAKAATAHVHYHLKSFGHCCHPCLGKTHAFFGGEHIAFAR